MPAYNKKILPLILVGLTFAAGCRGASENWVVLANSLPSQVRTNQAFVSIVLYILKQTHEPLLRRDDGENYSSRILRKWERSLDFRGFAFCPDQSLRFNARTKFTAGLLGKHLESVTRKLDDSAVLEIRDSCVNVKFARSHPNYLFYLTQYENAPTVERDGVVEDGLGPFMVEKVEKNIILLTRKVPVRRGYNTIAVRQNSPDISAGDRGIADRNLISGMELPLSAQGDYQGFYSTELRTGDLIINHLDPEMRRMIYNCTDIKMLRSSFFPSKSDFFDVVSVLPIGVPGAKQGEPRQDCGAALAALPHKHGPIIFSNWRTDNDEQMNRFAEAFFKRTGVGMRVVHYPPAEFKKMLHSRPRPYHLTIMHLDAVVPDHRAFLEVFFRKDGYLDFDLPVGAKFFEGMLSAEDVGRKHALAMSVVGELAKEAVALPLYQSVRVFWYPKKIENIVVGKGFLEYPEIGDFRW